MDRLVDEENLENTFSYLDNITIVTDTQAENYKCMEKFLEVPAKTHS